jgi:hypothetical protein
LIFTDSFCQNSRGSIYSFANNTIYANTRFLNSGQYALALQWAIRNANIRYRGLRGTSITFGVDGSGTHTYDLFTSATVGQVGLIFTRKNSDNYWSNLALTYNVYNTGTNPANAFVSTALQLRTSGDQFTWQTERIYGHLTLGSLTVASNANSNYVFSYDIDNGSGFSGSYTTIASGANLGITIASPNGYGFALRLRITCTVSSTANSITAFTVATTSSANAQAATAYPYQIYTPTIQGLVSGSIVGLYDNSGALVQSGSVGSSGSFTFNPIEFFTASTYTIKYRAYRYVEGSISVTLKPGSETQTVAQAIDANITQATAATVAAYSGIAINYSSQLATVSAAITAQQFYDYHAYDLSLIGNISQVDWLTSADRSNFTSTYNITIASGGSFSGSTGSITLSGAKTLTLATARTYTLSFVLGATGKVLLGASGSFGLTSYEFTVGAKIDTSITVGNTAIATVATAQLSNVSASSPTTGGGSVVIQTPATTISISGIPTEAGAVLGVIDLTTMVQTFPTITNGTATVVTDPTRNYFLACDARGYLREAVTLSGAVPSYTFNLTNFRALYESGISRASDITFNTTTFEVIVSDGTPNLSLADVFHTIEDYLADPLNPEAVFFSNPPYPQIVDIGGGSGRQYLFFPYDTVADEPNPVRIKPDPTNISDPTLTDFVIVHEGSTAPLFSIFDFSEANGRTIRFQTDAVAANVVVSGSGALTTEQSNQLAALFATLQASGVFSTTALANAPTGSGGGGSGLDAAGVRAAIGLAAANLDAQLASVNTNIDQIPTTPLLVNDSRLNFLDASIAANAPANVWSAATRSLTDKAGFSLASTQSFNLTGNITGNLSGSVGSVTNAVNLPTMPSNWITAAGIATDAIDGDSLAISAITEIQAGLSTYAGGDTPGTAALLSRLTSGRVANLDNLDAAITSRQETFTYTPPNNTAIEQIKARTDLLTFTGTNLNAIALAVGGSFPAFPAVPTALDNAAAIRTNLATELGRIDTNINSRATAGDVQVMVSGGFTDDDRTALLAIPTTPAPSADAIAQAVEAELVDEFAAIPDAGEIKTAIESSAVLAKQASVDDVADLVAAGL